MTMEDYQAAAQEVPWKLLAYKEHCVARGIILPEHIQLIPTNKCNGNCKWCSCSDVDREVEMSLYECCGVIRHFASRGTKAITVTGGGEPTIHPDIMAILIYANEMAIKTSLVTNGLKWGLAKSIDLSIANKCLTWLRVSVIDTTDQYYETKIISNIAHQLPNVDIGISFTVPQNVSFPLATRICHLADGCENITHVRFVQDLVNINERTTETMEKLCELTGYITKKAIYQHRDKYTRGMSPCYVSKMRPVVDATGYMYPCCGAQYAIAGKNRCMPEEMKMGHWRDFGFNTSYFDGKICDKCYYNHYNITLQRLLKSYKHKEFC